MDASFTVFDASALDSLEASRLPGDDDGLTSDVAFGQDDDGAGGGEGAAGVGQPPLGGHDDDFEIDAAVGLPDVTVSVDAGSCSFEVVTPPADAGNVSSGVMTWSRDGQFLAYACGKDVRVVEQGTLRVRPHSGPHTSWSCTLCVVGGSNPRAGECFCAVTLSAVAVVVGMP